MERSYSPLTISFAPSKPSLFRFARHLAVCHQPQIFFSKGFDQRVILRVQSCVQRHVSVKGQKALVIGYRTLNARSPSHYRPVRHDLGHTDTHFVTLQAAPIVELPASASGAARFSARAAESTPARNFFHLRFIAKASFFLPNFVAGKKLHGSLLGYRGALVFAINPGLVFG